MFKGTDLGLRRLDVFLKTKAPCRLPGGGDARPITRSVMDFFLLKLGLTPPCTET
jgi:hypothetical protein